MSEMRLSVLLLLVCPAFCHNVTEQCPNVKTSLSNIRKKRYLVFPDDSNVVLTISLVKAFMTHAPAGWNIALEIDVLFPLPDEKFVNEHSRRKHHRQKRELWQRIENALDYNNFNGRACILRCICESKSHLAPPGVSLVHDLLRVIFTAPLQEEYSNQLTDMYSQILDPNFCDQVHDCPFSILHFILTMNKRKY